MGPWESVPANREGGGAGGRAVFRIAPWGYGPANPGGCGWAAGWIPGRAGARRSASAWGVGLERDRSGSRQTDGGSSGQNRSRRNLSVVASCGRHQGDAVPGRPGRVSVRDLSRITSRHKAEVPCVARFRQIIWLMESPTRCPATVVCGRVGMLPGLMQSPGGPLEAVAAQPDSKTIGRSGRPICSIKGLGPAMQHPRGSWFDWPGKTARSPMRHFGLTDATEVSQGWSVLNLACYRSVAWVDLRNKVKPRLQRRSIRDQAQRARFEPSGTR
jgi:hypothetical protein